MPIDPRPGNPETWITNGDYPATALAQGVEGIVTITFDVDANGKATRCTATGGGPLLDDPTCRIALLRARFDPARDASGKAVESTFRLRFRWQKPLDELTYAMISAQVVRAAITRKGVLAKCELWRSKAEAVSPRSCDVVTGMTNLMGVLARNHNAGVLTRSERTMIEGVPEAARLPGSDIPPYWTQEQRITIDERGQVTGCRMVTSNSADTRCPAGQRFVASPGRRPLAIIHTVSEAFQPAQ